MGRLVFWLVIILFVGPFCGFMTGMAGPTILPTLASPAALLVCRQGTLLAQPASASTSYSVVFRTRFWCVDSATAVRSDVSTPVLYASGAIFAGALVIALMLVMALTEGFRFLRAR